jgi:hypothetical protein
VSEKLYPTPHFVWAWVKDPETGERTRRLEQLWSGDKEDGSTAMEWREIPEAVEVVHVHRRSDEAPAGVP